MTNDDPNLCIDCGLCCDGTLFHAVDITEGDDLTELRRMGAMTISDAESKVFLQPCPAFDGSGCTVHASRPERCRSYTCDLLRSVSNGDTMQDEARQIVRRARTLADSVRATFDLPSAVPSQPIRLGSSSLSAYLRVMDNDYSPEELAASFPPAAELIHILRSSFGWDKGKLP